MSDERVRNIVIVGGGAAGWLAAATLSRLLKPGFFEIRLLDIPQSQPGSISTTALPSFHRLNALLTINEQDLMQRTGATFKLGTRFVDWERAGTSYFHGFGSLGAKLEAVPFQHFWIRLCQSGLGGALNDYSIAAVASQQQRFARPASDRQSLLSQYAYGYHFQTSALAEYLRRYAQAHGVLRLERRVIGMQLRAGDGFVERLQLDDDSSIGADLYIDCTAGEALGVQQPIRQPRIDWSDWLPCDRAVILPCVADGRLPPYSQSTALPLGWAWQVRLQQCIDNGFAYPSRLVGDDEAAASLRAQLPGTALSEPRILSLSCGRPSRFWERNWLMLPGCSVEPLESTALHLVQTGILRLLACFPDRACSPHQLEEYNRLTAMEHDRIRDFLILHFHATSRHDSPLWEYCRDMPLPDSLRHSIELFRDSGRVAMLEEEHFNEDSWLSLMFGQGIVPSGYDPLADVLPEQEVAAALSFMREKIRSAVAALPLHATFIHEQCRAHRAVAP